MTRAEAGQLVSMLASMFDKQLRPDTARAYEAFMLDLDFELAMRACSRLIATTKWFPKVAEIREAVIELRDGPQKTGLEAWAEVGKAITSVGSYNYPKFADPKISACVRSLGWHYLCRSPNEASDRARFVEMYEDLASREHLDAVAGESLRLPDGTVKQLPTFKIRSIK